MHSSSTCRHRAQEQKRRTQVSGACRHRAQEQERRMQGSPLHSFVQVGRHRLPRRRVQQRQVLSQLVQADA